MYIWCFFWRGKEEVWGVMGQLLWYTQRSFDFFSKTSQKKPSQNPKNENQPGLPTLSVRPFFPMVFFPMGIPQGGPESHRSFVQRHPGLAATHHGTQGGCQLRGLARHVRQLPEADGIRGDMQRGVGNVPETWRRFWWMSIDSNLRGGWFDFWYLFDPLLYFKICSKSVRLFPTLEMFELFSQVVFCFACGIWFLTLRFGVSVLKSCESWWHFRKVLYRERCIHMMLPWN